MKETLIPQLKKIDARKTPFIVLNQRTFNLPVLKRFINEMPEDFEVRFNEETKNLDFSWNGGRGNATILAVEVKC
jgi:hypothetical protein